MAKKAKMAAAYCRENITIENELAGKEVELLNLTVYLVNGRYLLILLDYDGEGYLDVRKVYNSDASKEDWEYVNGELHSSTLAFLFHSSFYRHQKQAYYLAVVRLFLM